MKKTSGRQLREFALCGLLALAAWPVLAAGSGCSPIDFDGDAFPDRTAVCRTTASCAALVDAALNAGRIADAHKAADDQLSFAQLDVVRADDDDEVTIGDADVIEALVHEGDVSAKEGNYPAARAWYNFALARVLPSRTASRIIAQARDLASSRLAAIASRDVVDTIPASGATFKTFYFDGSIDAFTLRPVAGRHDTYDLKGTFAAPEIYDDRPPVLKTDRMNARVRFDKGVANVPMGRDHTSLDAARPSRPLESGNLQCSLQLRLAAPETLDVTVNGKSDCGFGAGFGPEGTYRMIAATAREDRPDCAN